MCRWRVRVTQFTDQKVGGSSRNHYYGDPKRAIAAATTFSRAATYSAIRSVRGRLRKASGTFAIVFHRLTSFDRSGWDPASIGHDPPRHQLPVKCPSGRPRRSSFIGWRKRKFAFKVSNSANIYGLPLLDHGISEFVEPVGYGVASQFRAGRVPPALPFLLGREVAFQMLERPCDGTSLFQKVADGCFRSTLSWRVVEILHGMSHGLQHFKRVSDPLPGRYRCRRHARPLLVLSVGSTSFGSSHLRARPSDAVRPNGGLAPIPLVLDGCRANSRGLGQRP